MLFSNGLKIAAEENVSTKIVDDRPNPMPFWSTKKTRKQIGKQKKVYNKSKQMQMLKKEREITTTK